jgi:hypothetical protein
MAAGFIVDKMMLTDAPLLYPPGQVCYYRVFVS